MPSPSFFDAMEANGGTTLPGQNKFEGYAGFDTNMQRGLTPGSAARIQSFNESLPAGAVPVGAPGLPMQMQEMSPGAGMDPQQFLKDNVNKLLQQR